MSISEYGARLDPRVVVEALVQAADGDVAGLGVLLGARVGEDAAAAEHVVEGHQAAGAQELEHQLGVARVAGLVGVDEGQVVGAGRAVSDQGREGLLGRGDAQLDPVGQPGHVPGLARDGGPLLAGVAAQEVPALAEGLGHGDRRVAREGAHLESPPCAHQAREQAQQLALLGRDLHLAPLHRQGPVAQIGQVRRLAAVGQAGQVVGHARVGQGAAGHGTSGGWSRVGGRKASAGRSLGAGGDGGMTCADPVAGRSTRGPRRPGAQASGFVSVIDFGTVNWRWPSTPCRKPKPDLRAPTQGLPGALER